MIRRERPKIPERTIPVYTGSDVPVAYDPNWQFFTNLTPDQIAWFQDQPEWKAYVLSVTNG